MTHRVNKPTGRAKKNPQEFSELFIAKNRYDTKFYTLTNYIN